jgi:2-C-methyl-D-erythritol 2,4-cyclodiphosphate synthase
MTQTPKFRIGQGFDVHRFGPRRRLVLGGVEIPHPLGLEGHSDADVLTHAICDALLGAAGLGDIGVHFPDTDAAYRDADSLGLLAHVAGLLAKEGWRIGNIDSTIIAQAPKVAPHIGPMRERLATACGIDAGQIGIKATTSEGLGFTGRGEGIAAMAAALIVRAA